MSLSGTIQLAANSLLAQQVGLQVVGSNIANAATPGYLRQRVDYVPVPTQERGGLNLGTGVRVQGITSQINQFVQDRARRAVSDLAAAEPQEKTYAILESILGELGDTDLSSILGRFFSRFNEILVEPESSAARRLAISQGEAVTNELNRLDRQVRQHHGDINAEIASVSVEMNQFLREIADLNLKIVELEGGGAIQSDAVGFRDQREMALSELAKLIDIQAVEDSTGSISVFAGGDFLVIAGRHRDMETIFTQQDGLTKANVHIVQTESALQSATGKLSGLLAARDEVLKGFLKELNEFSQTFIFEFNQLYVSGLGEHGHLELTSDFHLENPDDILDEAGLAFTPQNGSFQVKVRNRQTNVTETSDIQVDLNGLDDDTSLRDLSAALNAVEGISASLVAVHDRTTLSVTADGPNLEFDFANDNSGVLAALGLGTFFTGFSAAESGVRKELVNELKSLAISRNGFGENVENGVKLAGFLDQRLASQDEVTLTSLYDQFAGGTIQASAVARSVADGLRIFQQTVEGEQLAISGVNIDEEAVQMIAHQRAFQASARLIATASELLELLMAL